MASNAENDFFSMDIGSRGGKIDGLVELEKDFKWIVD